jgi:RNA-splicing ligase RtcB
VKYRYPHIGREKNRTMELINLSAEPEGKLRAWLPHNLVAQKVVFLPDACPGKSPLPTGTAVLTNQPDWRQFAVSDCGCGMRLLSTNLTVDDLTRSAWEEIAENLRGNKGGLGDLGGGNHFLDALLPYSDTHIHILIHTGSRDESGLVDQYVEESERFDEEFGRVTRWAEENRRSVQTTVEAVLGPTKLVFDLPHNTYEALPEDAGVIIRKGAVHVKPGSLNIIPSHMAGDVALVRATEAVENSLYSLSHGTGRSMSRSGSKEIADRYDFSELRSRVLIPHGVKDASLRTDGPFAYRDLDDCLALLKGYIEEVERFSVVAYMGHL